jgi:hypothetical protein
VFLAQVAAPDAGLADVAALGMVDPGTHGMALLPLGFLCRALGAGLRG